MQCYPCLLLLLFTFASFVYNSKAAGLTENHKSKLSDHFIKYGVGCLANYSLTTDDIQSLQSFKMPQGKEAPCFFVCIFKTTNMLDTDGKMDPDGVLDVAKTIFNDKEELEAVSSVFQKCAYVNDLEVTDGNQGCDRAKFVLSCIIRQSNKDNQGDKLPLISGDDATVKRKGLRDIIGGVFKALIRLACGSVNKETFHGKIITKLLPGIETVNLLCAFVS